jgi:hypothetical protein
MHALYRKPYALPSLALAIALASCEDNPSPKELAEPISETYLEVLQEVEVLKHSLDEQKREQQRLDELLGRDQATAR